MEQLSSNLQENVPLASYTTFRIGGPARFFFRISDPDQLVEAVTFARARDLPVFVLGGGSNLLVDDAGFPGVVLQIAIDHPLCIEGGYVQGNHIGAPATKTPLTYRVPAGFDWDALVLLVAEAGISGIECLAGIPGLVGGSPVQNIGAYGQEVASTIAAVHAFDLQSLTFVTLPAELCGFSYRSSIFNTIQRNRYIITAVTFRFDLEAAPSLSYADLQKHFAGSRTPPTPLEIYDAVRSIRHKKGMLLIEGEQDCRSAGSFFKNPIVPAATLTAIADSLNLDPGAIPHWPTSQSEDSAGAAAQIKLPAAWLLERAGFHKGFSLGAAGISSRHTLALVNLGGATAADILALRDLIRVEVQRRFNISLEQEPVQPSVLLPQGS